MEGEPKVTIESTTVRRRNVLAGISDSELRREVESADILIVPDEGHAGYDGPVFPQGTMEVFRVLGEQAPPGVRAGIATTDEAYEELSLHAADLILPAVLTHPLVAQVAINLLASFVYDVLKSAVARKTTRVRATLYVEGADCINLKYDGPAQQFSEALTAAFEREKPRLVSPRTDR